jgi:hypothetical protein
VKEVVHNLSAEDFCEIASLCEGSSSTAWVFGKMIAGWKVYIKLEKSKYSNSGAERPTLYCWAFHFSDHPMEYPFKNRE